MKILVTGDTGFIGSELMVHLKHKNIYGLSSTKNSKKILKTSLQNTKLLDSFLSKNNFDVVIHLFALLENKSPMTIFNSNCKSTINLLESCVKNGVKKFIFTSSHAVYGSTNYLPIDESHPTNPTTNYGITKIIGEEISKMYSISHGIKVLNLRLSSVYGINQHKERIIPRMILHSLLNRQFKLNRYKNGFQLMDLVHIKDVCHAIELAIKSNVSFGTYNIASGKSITIEKISKILSKITKNNIFKINQLNSETNHFFYDVSNSKKDLKFSHKYFIDNNTLSTIVNYYKKNKITF